MKRSRLKVSALPTEGRALGRCQRRIGAQHIFRGYGFTLIELLVVLAIVALLVSIALPRYFNKIEKTKETVLLENLHVVRKTIDDFYGDKGRYPDSLDELVAERYLHTLPIDPMTESSSTWIVVSPTPPSLGNVADVRSGAEGNSLDGIPFSGL